MLKDNLKAIPADRLRDILADLPKGTFVTPTTDGNLALLNSELAQFGAVDLGSEGLCVLIPREPLERVVNFAL